MSKHKEAIYPLLLAALLMFCIVKGLGETPRRYEKRVQRRIRSAAHRLDSMDINGYSWHADTLYTVRAEIDLELCGSGLHDYKAGVIDKAEMDRLMKQLDRDMEDYPPQVAAK